ncbi:MAG: ketopantoate reductase family protein [Chloroflexi bacterium]|nr:MAG: ketopantoate reductase family protein [Chloroflexota bacterium]
MRIVVIGAGAVGGWVGGRLAAAGHAVVLVGRSALVQAVQREGLRLRSPDGEEVLREATVVPSTAEAASSGPYDLALVTVKSYDTEAVIAEMKAADLEARRFLSLQNGVFNEERLADAFGAERVVAGTFLNPVSVPTPGTVVLEKRKGGVGLAPLDPAWSIAPWVAAFNEAGLPTRAYADYRAMKWSKLLLNLIGNASAAILDLSSEAVFAHPRLCRLELRAMRETLAVMRRLGIPVVSLPGYPVPLLAWAVRRLPAPLLCPLLRRLVTGGRGAKPPSLLIEMRRGRRRTEVEDLNGAVVHWGAQVGLETPVNRALAETLSRLAEGRITWDQIRHRPETLLAVVEGMAGRG